LFAFLKIFEIENLDGGEAASAVAKGIHTTNSLAHTTKLSNMASTSTNPHLTFDAGLLLSTDSSAIDAKQYANEATREQLIQARVLASTKALLSHLYTLPITQHPDHGPLAALPAPTYPLLPREKALPKPKAETMWEAFAKRKGIQHVKKDKMVWDEEAKEWVPSWGFKGKNKKEEEQWIHEIPANAEEDFNPVSQLKKVRKEKSIQNKAQQLKNLARANAKAGKPAPLDTETAFASVSNNIPLGKGAGTKAATNKRAERAQKMAQLDADVQRGRTSTASMGRFDKKLEGEGKEKGLKRKVCVAFCPGLRLAADLMHCFPFLIVRGQ
jgi:regulator of ribosome biosynthesis